MSVLAGPAFALAGLLGFAGIQKVAWPSSSATALRAAGLPSSAMVGRALGLAEIVVAALTVAVGTRATAGLLALTYAGFALFSWRLLVRTHATASCGCFGASDAPATQLHVALNVVAATTCAAAIVWPTGSLAHVVADQPSAGLPFLALTALAAWLWYVLLEVVPELQRAMAANDVPTDEPVSAS